METHKFHHLGRKFLRFIRAVPDSNVVHQVAQPHDPQADATRAIGRFSKLRHRRHVGVGADHVVQKARAENDALFKLGPIHRTARPTMLREIDRPQATILVGSEPLLAAWIRGLQFIEVRNRIVAIGGIKEQDPGLAIVMGMLHHHVKYLSRAYGLDFLARMRSDQIMAPIVPYSFHKFVGYANRDVEVGNLVFVDLASDEIAYIRMVDAQDGHIRPSPRPTLSDFSESLVVYT